MTYEYARFGCPWQNLHKYPGLVWEWDAGNSAERWSVGPQRSGDNTQEQDAWPREGRDGGGAQSGLEQPNTAGPISDHQHRLDADGPAPPLHMSANSTSWQFLSSQTKSQLEKATK